MGDSHRTSGPLRLDTRQNDVGDGLGWLTSISRNEILYANGIMLLVGHGFGCWPQTKVG
jgi:hypothetical protein